VTHPSTVDRFYDLMDEDPILRHPQLHPADLGESRNKLAWVPLRLAGGPPNTPIASATHFLRRRHLPFAIGEAERDQWMGCMIRAMQEWAWMMRCRGNSPRPSQDRDLCATAAMT